MRYVMAAMVASLLGACASPPPAPTCSTRWECEIQAYSRAGG